MYYEKSYTKWNGNARIQFIPIINDIRTKRVSEIFRFGKKQS